MAFLDTSFREIFAAQMVSIFGGLIAGILLAVYTDKILLIPGMLILLPGFLEMRGNISGTLASRISSGLFLGMIKPSGIKSGVIRANMLASFLLVIVVSFALGILASLFNYFVFDVFIAKIIFIPVIAGIIANSVEIPLTLFATFYIYRKGHDPNNIMGPFVTSTGDITSILSLLAALWLV
ncbi:MAG TPA: magnesium transporter [Candidatus Nanoarchaeia archaeon]|nr:magnesium transporter [Candidatus Nanoarchaeia archaeon]